LVVCGWINRHRTHVCLLVLLTDIDQFLPLRRRDQATPEREKT
jgi:hypothetical protein